MHLHDDRNAFEAALKQVAAASKVSAMVLERDYYQTLILRELAEKQSERGVPAYYKGGGALYKTTGSHLRLSEDIDVSLDSRGMTNSKRNRELKNVARGYASLAKDGPEHYGKNDAMATFAYDTVLRPGHNATSSIEVEATSFTIAEPTEEWVLSDLLWQLATPEQREALSNYEGTGPFQIKAISLERSFVDKVFALEAYSRALDDDSRAPAEASKHAFDLAYMADLPRVQELLGDDAAIKRLLDIRLEEERSRTGGVADVAPRDFQAMKHLPTNRLAHSWSDLSGRYLVSPDDVPSLEHVSAVLASMGDRLDKLPSWREAPAATDWKPRSEADATNGAKRSLGANPENVPEPSDG